MKKLNEIAASILQNGEAKVIIGYSEGSTGKVHPFFAREEKETQQLIFDKRCTQNLAVYLYKKETAGIGKPAIVANIHTLRAVIRLVVEKQLKEGSIIVLYVNEQDEIIRFNSFTEIESFLSTANVQLNETDQALIHKLKAMNPNERWSFWEKEMENCIKCYACRQACPLCYCTQCTVEVNQPQWIPVASNTLGNLEWHIMRAMHLSGRCIECGQCGEACPVHIPIHLLPIMLAEEAKELYGFTSGLNLQEGCAMSTFKPDDKENFIG